MSDAKDLEAAAASLVNAGETVCNMCGHDDYPAMPCGCLCHNDKASERERALYGIIPRAAQPDAKPVDGEWEPSVENAIAHLRGLNIDQEPVNLLNAEVRRLRALFGGFQLECCEDWTCAQDHARKAGETIHELRAQLAANTIPAAVENLHKHREEIARLKADSDRLRDQYASLCATLRVALADAERNLK
jgi:hypothetical protein